MRRFCAHSLSILKKTLGNPAQIWVLQPTVWALSFGGVQKWVHSRHEIHAQLQLPPRPLRPLPPAPKFNVGPQGGLGSALPTRGTRGNIECGGGGARRRFPCALHDMSLCCTPPNDKAHTVRCGTHISLQFRGVFFPLHSDGFLFRNPILRTPTCAYVRLRCMACRFSAPLQMTKLILWAVGPIFRFNFERCFFLYIPMGSSSEPPLWLKRACNKCGWGPRRRFPCTLQGMSLFCTPPSDKAHTVGCGTHIWAEFPHPFFSHTVGCGTHISLEFRRVCGGRRSQSAQPQRK